MARTVLPSPSPSTSSSDEEDTAPTPPPPSSASALKPPRPNKPVSSSESEEEEDDEEGSSSESEGSSPPPPPKKSPVITSAPPSKKPPVTSPTRTKKPTPVTSPPPPPKPAQPSDAESESDSEPEPPPPAIAPEKSKKPEKKRKAPDMTNGEPSKKFFMRVWTTDDITALMKGVVEFHEKHGHEPTSTPDLHALLDIVKQQLHSEFTITQIMTKIRNLKKKYVADSAKEKGVFRNEHDKLVYDLSKKVWGSLNALKGEVGDKDGEKGNSNAQKLGSITASPRKKMNNSVVVGGTVADGRSDDSTGLNWAVKLIMQDFGDGNLNTHGMLEQGLTILKPEVLSAFGESWRDLNFEEFRFSNKRIQLKSNIVKAVEKALKSAGF